MPLILSFINELTSIVESNTFRKLSVFKGNVFIASGKKLQINFRFYSILFTNLRS